MTGVAYPPAPARHPVDAFYAPGEFEGTALCQLCQDEEPFVVAWRWFPNRDADEGGPGWGPVCRRHARGRVAWPTREQCEAAGQPYLEPGPTLPRASAVTTPVKHTAHALAVGLSEYGRQDVHLHPCCADHRCNMVLVGQGRLGLGQRCREPESAHVWKRLTLGSAWSRRDQEGEPLRG